MKFVSAVGFLALVWMQPTHAEQLPELEIDASSRSQVIAASADAVERMYVYPELGTRMAKSLRAREQAGDYATVTSAYHLANSLTQDLQAISRDKHLRVFYTKMQPGSGPAVNPTPEEAAKSRASRRKANYGFEKAEILDNNIGYVEIRAFLEPDDEAADAAAAMMTFVANAEALIVDLRRNGGGSPAMVALISSYLFDSPTHLNSLYWRTDDRLQEFWTTADPKGRKFGQQKPVYVLTSKDTFSAAEEFAYNLQALKRATLVGEATAGGAHPGRPFQVHELFAVWIPTGRAINPSTKSNWEGIGVKPDIEASADSALENAKMLAAQEIRKTTNVDGPRGR